MHIQSKCNFCTLITLLGDRSIIESLCKLAPCATEVQASVAVSTFTGNICAPADYIRYVYKRENNHCKIIAALPAVIFKNGHTAPSKPALDPCFPRNHGLKVQTQHSMCNAGAFSSRQTAYRHHSEEDALSIKYKRSIAQDVVLVKQGFYKITICSIRSCGCHTKRIHPALLSIFAKIPL